MYFYSLFHVVFTHRYIRIAFAASIDMQIDQSIVDRDAVWIITDRFPSG